MKIYTNKSTTTNNVKAASNLASFNEDGSAPNAAHFKEFNKGKQIELSNGITIALNTGRLLVDEATGDIKVYLNITLLMRDGRTKYGWNVHHIQYQKYTPEEFKKLYNYLSSLSAEEALEQMRLNSEEHYR